MNSTYLTSVSNASQLPYYGSPEVAFIGRSNSGKSTLLNALLNRKRLARTSSTPGRTQMINFFSYSPNREQKLIFADLPGYGFNVAPKDIKRGWNSLLEEYFTREEIRKIIYVRDIRRSFLPFEWDYIKRLSTQVPTTIVLTKCDKESKRMGKIREEQVLLGLSERHITPESVFVVSNLEKNGINELRTSILKPTTSS